MKAFGWFLAVFAAAIVLCAVALLVVAWIEGRAGPRPKSIEELRVKSADTRQQEPNCAPPARRPIVDAVIHSYESGSGTVILGDELCVPVVMVAALVDGAGRRVTRLGRHGLEMKPAYGHERVRLELNGDMRSDEEPPRQEVSLSSLLRAAGRFIRTGSVPLPVTGSVSKYPFDSYATTVSLQLRIVGGSVGLAAGGGGAARSMYVPFVLKSYVGAAIAPLGVETTTGSATSARGLALDTHGRLLGIEMERSTNAQMYVVLIAVVPFILELLLLGVILRTSQSLNSEMLVGFGAVLLAIVPIRAVLVPATAPELTLVDYWLGVEVAILAALACLAVSLAILNATTETTE
jgi:hypothetical protein